ncbi:hypothetical protein D3C72_1095230 [compost metagenome]
METRRHGAKQQNVRTQLVLNAAQPGGLAVFQVGRIVAWRTAAGGRRDGAARADIVRVGQARAWRNELAQLVGSEDRGAQRRVGGPVRARPVLAADVEFMVFRVARAGRQLDLVRHLLADLAEHGLRFELAVALDEGHRRGVLAHGRLHEDHGAVGDILLHGSLRNLAAVDIEAHLVLFIEQEQAGHPLERRVVVRARLQLVRIAVELRPVRAVFRLEAGEQARIGIVAVLALVAAPAAQVREVQRVRRLVIELALVGQNRLVQGARRVDQGRAQLLAPFRFGRQVDVAGALVEEVVGDEGAAQLRRELPQQGGAHAHLVAGAILGRARHDVRAAAEVHRAVVAILDGGDAQRHVVGKRDIDHALRLQVALVAHGDAGRAHELGRARRGRHEVDGAGRGIAAVQRALRSARHLDVRQVVHQRRGALRTRRIHAVDIKGDSRVAQLRVVGRTDAAHVDVHAARVAMLLDDEAGHHGGQRRQILDLVVLQGVLVEGGDGQRRLLHEGIAARGRDDDAVHLFGCRLCRVRGGSLLGHGGAAAQQDELGEGRMRQAEGDGIAFELLHCCCLLYRWLIDDHIALWLLLHIFWVSI